MIRRFRRLRNRALECRQLGRKILGSFWLHAVLQTLIKHERVPQIQNCALIGRTFDRLKFVRLLALLVDLFQERRQLRETEIFPIALLPAKQTEHLRVLNDEGRIFIRDRRVEQGIAQPFDRANLSTIVET